MHRRAGIPSRVLVVAAVAGALATIACHTSVPPLPDGVTKQTLRVRLTDRDVRVDLYAPRAAGNAPIVIVAHGFSRGRRHMAGWGGSLAANGFIAAVPDQPSWANAAQNSRALVELLDKIRSRDITLPVAPGSRAAMLGFSMGGLTSLMAASRCRVDAWIGLDPVDFNGAGRRAAEKIRHPVAILRAEPSPWNRYGDARALLESFRVPVFALRVRRATHCDVEWPSDLLGRLACGPTDPARHAVFERYALAFLRATLNGAASATDEIRRAANDSAVAEVTGP